MTTPAALDHVTAMNAHLAAQTGLPSDVGEKPEAGGWQGSPGQSAFTAYHVLYPDPGEVDAITLGGQRNRIVLHVILHSVGSGWDQALWAGDKARTALLETPFVVAGRRLRRVDQDLAPPPLLRDDDVQPPLFIQVAEYVIRSEPAE